MPRAPIPREGPHCWSRLCCRPRLKRQVLLNSLYSACQSQSPSVSLILCIELIPSYLCTLPEVKMKPAHPSWGAALELACGVSSGVACPATDGPGSCLSCRPLPRFSSSVLVTFRSQGVLSRCVSYLCGFCAS